MQDVAKSNLPLQYLQWLWKPNTNKLLGRYRKNLVNTQVAENGTTNTSGVEPVAMSADSSTTPKQTM